MEIKKFGKGIKESLQDATDAVKAKVKEVDLTEVKEAGSKAAGQMQDLLKKLDVKKEKEESKLTDSRLVSQTEVGISTREAMKVIYYLMSVDGEILHGEEEKFDEIGEELIPNFSDVKEDILSECKKCIDKVIDPEDYKDVLREGVEEALSSNPGKDETVISAKLLVWNLLAIAHSDEAYAEDERSLVKYVVRKCDIDRTIFLEMESSMFTLLDLEKELEWIKTTDKPYLVIEEMVNEINKRKEVIHQSVIDLITL